MVNLRWDIYNMVTVWLMVLIMFAAIGLGKSVIAGSATGSGN